MVCTWVLKSSWAVQPGPGAGKWSYAYHSREKAKSINTDFQWWDPSLRVMAVTHAGNINLHVSLDHIANARVSEFGFTRR